MKFTIDPIIFELFPDFNAGLVAMKGIDAETLPLEEIVRQSLKKMVK